MRRGQALGLPLPEVQAFERLYRGEFEFQFRGGQVTVIGGQSGSFKSGFCINLLANMPGVRGIYVSADMNDQEFTARLTASVTGEETKNVLKGLRLGAEDYYAAKLAGIENRFALMFDSNPTFEDIEQMVDAWVESYDDYPRFVVLDNLLDIVPSAGADEFSGYKAVLLDAKALARSTGAHVFVLHHMTEAGTHPTEPAPKKALLGKVSQTPNNILSVAKEGDCFKVSVVKQRMGKDDPTGVIFERFRVHPERNGFSPWTGQMEVRTTWSAPEEAA